MFYEFEHEMCKVDLDRFNIELSHFCNYNGYLVGTRAWCLSLVRGSEDCRKVYPKNYDWTNHPREKEKVWEVCQSPKAA